MPALRRSRPTHKTKQWPLFKTVGSNSSSSSYFEDGIGKDDDGPPQDVRQGQDVNLLEALVRLAGRCQRMAVQLLRIGAGRSVGAVAENRRRRGRRPRQRTRQL